MTGPLGALAATVAAQRAMDEVVKQQVRECRRVGHSWNEIASTAGVSKPTALNRWKDVDVTNTINNTDWDLAEGEVLRRRDLHQRYGGNIQSGIAPSRSSDQILLFASPSGESHGYTDGDNGDGTYSYTGEGQRGDQTMTRGNRAILDHRANNKYLRLFEAKGDGWVTYLGEYEYDTHRQETIPGSGNSGPRQGIVFTLRKV